MAASNCVLTFCWKKKKSLFLIHSSSRQVTLFNYWTPLQNNWCNLTVRQHVIVTRVHYSKSIDCECTDKDWGVSVRDMVKGFHWWDGTSSARLHFDLWLQTLPQADNMPYDVITSILMHYSLIVTKCITTFTLHVEIPVFETHRCLCNVGDWLSRLTAAGFSHTR